MLYENVNTPMQEISTAWGSTKKEEAQMSLDFSERRRYERVQLELPVTGQCLSVEGDIYPFQGKTRDVSLEGFCVKINSTNGFKVGQDVNFNTRLFKGKPLIKARGRVCWVHTLPHPPWFINMGVMLTRMLSYRYWYKKVNDEIRHRSVTT